MMLCIDHVLSFHRSNITSFLTWHCCFWIHSAFTQISSEYIHCIYVCSLLYITWSTCTIAIL